MKRRGFLKILGGLLSLPVAAKLMKGKSFLKPAAKTVAKTLPKVSGMPEWFTPLVNKIMKEGVDISPQAGRVEDMTTVKKLEIPSETGKPEVITLTENKATGNITIESSSGGVADSPFEISYTPPKTDINVQTGEPVKYPGDFSVIENRPKPDYNNIGKVEFDYDNFDIDSAYSDLERLEKIGTGKIKDVKKMEQRAKGREMINQSPYEDIMDRFPGPPEPDDFADGGLASFINGGKVKKKKLTPEVIKDSSEDLSEEELKQKYEEGVMELAGAHSPPGLRFNTEEGDGGIGLIFGPKIRKDKYPEVNIKDPRVELSYTPDSESETAPRFGFNIGPKGGSLGFTKRFANGGLTNTIPPAMGPDSQGVESLFRRRYS